MKSKHTSELTAQDLQEYPIWKAGVEAGWDYENCDPGGQVLPYAVVGDLDCSRDDLLVACRFTFADGSVNYGYITPSTEYDFGFLQPTVASGRGTVSFWCGSDPPTNQTMRRDYAILGKTPSEIFPARFETTIPIKGGPITGTIHGFMCA
jgi:hypothetical protein